MPNTHLKQTGFTLIEVLLALTLAAMLMVLLAGAVNVVVQDWERGSQQLDDKLDKGLLMLQIERALEGAFPHAYRDQKSKAELIYFAGDKKSLHWVSTVSPQRRAGLTVWHLQPAKDKKKGMELTVAPVYSGDPEKVPNKTKTRSVLENYQMHFEYLLIDPYDDQAGEAKREWRDEWSAEKHQALPSAVRIKAQSEKSANQSNIEIIAPIAANQHYRLKLKRQSLQ